MIECLRQGFILLVVNNIILLLYNVSISYSRRSFVQDGQGGKIFLRFYNRWNIRDAIQVDDTVYCEWPLGK